MSEEKTSILLSDISIEGEVVEKDKIIVDEKINGDIKAEDIETYSNSNIKGNINSKNASLGGKVKGNINSDQIKIRKTANIDGMSSLIQAFNSSYHIRENESILKEND